MYNTCSDLLKEIENNFPLFHRVIEILVKVSQKLEILKHFLFSQIPLMFVKLSRNTENVYYFLIINHL
jgi:hypothetical protein